jgi:hypothetical protein
LSTIASLRAICRVVLFSVLVLPNLLLLPVKIVYLLLLPLPLLLCVMQLANLRSYTAAREISESALQLPNVYLGFVILFQLEHR